MLCYLQCPLMWHFLYDGGNTSASCDGAGGGGLATEGSDTVGDRSERQQDCRDTLDSPVAGTDGDPHQDTEATEQQKGEKKCEHSHFQFATRHQYAWVLSIWWRKEISQPENIIIEIRDSPPLKINGSTDIIPRTLGKLRCGTTSYGTL